MGVNILVPIQGYLGQNKAMSRGFAQRVLFLSFFFLSVGHSQNENTPPNSKDILNMAELIRHYQQYPELITLLEKNVKDETEAYKKFDSNTLKSLPTASFKNLQTRFYTDFVSYKEIRAKIQQNVKILEEKKIALPLSQNKEIIELNLKITASNDQLKQSKFVLFDTSLKANRALNEMLKSPSVQKVMSTTSQSKETDSNLAKKNPKMPGLFQGSRADRLNTSEAEKLNLTPVDPEFYKTQLGKKLEKDLGGRADYWSYDFDQDELYVVVGKDTGKLRVKQKDQGTRIIQTRIGSDFQDFPSDYQGDVAVDLNIAKGRFLTGDKADPTLFGEFPTTPGFEGASEEPHQKSSKKNKHNH
jgi:uncharacterized protein YpmB